MSERDCENCKHHTEKGCKSWDCEFERKVTRKDVIKVFEDMKKGIYPYYPNVYLDIAINSLEIDERYELEYEQADPCGDCISRADARHLIAEVNRKTLGCISTKAFNALYNGIDELSPVTPQPKTGHWIEKDGFDGDTYYDCSVCGESFCLIDGTPTDNLYNYCPNCGAMMAEVEE